MDAEAAIRDLRAHRLRDNEIFVVRPPLKGERPCLESLVAAIAQCAIMKSEAMIYAKRVARGGTLITVHAPFDLTERVSALLDIRDPVLRSIGPKHYPPLQWDDAAPFSSVMQWPTLFDEPTPFAKFWSVPELADHRFLSSRRRGRRSRPRSPAPLSDRLGLRLLSTSPTPLSSSLGLSLLSDSPTPLSNRMKWPVLSDNPTPLSSKCGWKVLQ
jgi:hypothetical protein